jgi:hypothetical protein
VAAYVVDGSNEMVAECVTMAVAVTSAVVQLLVCHMMQ